METNKEQSKDSAEAFEHALQESEDRYHQLVELSPDTIAVHSEGKIVFINIAGVKLLGAANPEQLIGKQIMDFLHPEYRDIVKERTRQIAEEGKEVPLIEEKFIRLDGTIIDVEVTAIPITYQGKPAVQAVVHDITKRKLAEEAIKVSETRYHELFNNINNGVAVYEARNDGEEFIITDFNHAAERIENVSKEDLIGKSVTEVFPGVREFGLFDIFQRVWRTGKSEHHPIPFYQDARLAGWRDNYVYKLPTGKIVAVYEDITERKRAEEALRAREEFLNHLLEYAPVSIYITDADKRLRLVNRRWEIEEGKQRIDILGLPLDQVFSKEIARKFDADNQEVIESDMPLELEETDGSPLDPHHYFTVKFPMHDTHGQVEAVGGISVDITERKRVEEALRESEEKYRTLAAYLQTALEDERTSIAREIHDEFGQRLTAFKMDLAWLSTRITPAEPQVQEKMAVMTNMVQEMIQYTRQVASNLRPGLLDDLGLNAAIEWYANDWSARHGKGIFIHLPDREFPLIREMNTALYRILQETLTNVARHAEAKRVDVYLEMADDHVILKVRDNGRGISQKEIHSSTALGLLGMRERAYQFGGGLEISAKPGKGTTVQVRLPLKQGKEPG